MLPLPPTAAFVGSVSAEQTLKATEIFDDLLDTLVVLVKASSYSEYHTHHAHHQPHTMHAHHIHAPHAPHTHMHTHIHTHTHTHTSTHAHSRCFPSSRARPQACSVLKHAQLLTDAICAVCLQNTAPVRVVAYKRPVFPLFAGHGSCCVAKGTHLACRGSRSVRAMRVNDIGVNAPLNIF